MEVKEHIFLFLPILAFVILLVIWFKGDRLQENKKLRNALAFVALITLIIAVSMALGGMLISGAAR
jgi:phosphoglycerol transferase MdoB-like AlkP superfamily enzyme